MEAKFFQDNQVLVKKEEKRLRELQKLKDAEVIQQKIKDAQIDAENEKARKKQKYHDHLLAMKEQT